MGLDSLLFKIKQLNHTINGFKNIQSLKITKM